MVPNKPKKTSLSGKLLLAALVGLILASLVVYSKADAASLAVANRCPTTITANSVAYHCWAAYPESFSLVGYALSKYRLTWAVTCDSRTVKSWKTDEATIGLYAGRLSRRGTKERAAYNLMDNNDVCKIDIVATRTAGSGDIALELVINQNHALPVHN